MPNALANYRFLAILATLVGASAVDEYAFLREDVQAYVKEAVKRAEAAPAATGGGIPGMLPWPKVDFSKFGEVEEVELGRIQKISGANLSRNWVMIPPVRASAQHKLKIIPQTKQLRLGVTVGDRSRDQTPAYRPGR